VKYVITTLKGIALFLASLVIILFLPVCVLLGAWVNPWFFTPVVLAFIFWMYSFGKDWEDADIDEE
jgi:hypothetical protein